MKGFLTLAWLLAYSVSVVTGGLLELKSMIEEVTGKNALMDYGFYGCYCGLGGHGVPKDPTDWCCWMHDRCYGKLEEEGCDIRAQYYTYRVRRGLVTCDLGNIWDFFPWLPEEVHIQYRRFGKHKQQEIQTHL
ncbi:phospholipase A2 group V isoform X2 [Cavia porcellus]|uniref:phospholipase A2 group V isoform X2 n=1 Tax=Cavia porcellus TaxID=10141 RepID=UPI002FE025DB